MSERPSAGSEQAASRMEDRGFELPPENAGYTGGSPEDGAKSGALSASIASGGASVDADLAMIVERWPTLPDDVRRAIVAMIEAASDSQ